MIDTAREGIFGETSYRVPIAYWQHRDIYIVLYFVRVRERRWTNYIYFSRKTRFPLTLLELVVPVRWAAVSCLPSINLDGGWKRDAEVNAMTIHFLPPFIDDIYFCDMEAGNADMFFNEKTSTILLWATFIIESKRQSSKWRNEVIKFGPVHLRWNCDTHQSWR